MRGKAKCSATSRPIIAYAGEITATKGAAIEVADRVPR